MTINKKVVFGSALVTLIVSNCEGSSNLASPKQQQDIHASPSEQLDDKEPSPVRTRLVVDRKSKPARIGVLFELEQKWHIYAKKPGDSGLPTRVQFAIDGKPVDSETQYPKAEKFVLPGNVVNFGYEKQALLFAQSPSKLSDVKITAETSWLACRAERCLPGKQSLKRYVATQSTDDHAVFEQWFPARK